MSLTMRALIVLFCASAPFLAVGCSAVDAIVGGPEKHFGDASPERLALIAGTLEEQGHVGQAQVVYSRLLKEDPKNLAAKSRLEHLVALGVSSETEGLKSKSLNQLAPKVEPAIASVTKPQPSQCEPVAVAVELPRNLQRTFTVKESIATGPLLVGGALEQPIPAMLFNSRTMERFDSSSEVEPAQSTAAGMVRFASSTRNIADQENAPDPFQLQSFQSYADDLSEPQPHQDISASLDKQLFPEQDGEEPFGAWRSAQPF